MLCGLDLARTRDFAALAKLDESDGYLNIRIKLWVPHQAIADKEETDKIPLSAWINDGHVVGCPGEEIDSDMIADEIVRTHTTVGIEELGYDPYNAGQLVSKLRKEYGLICTAVPQTMPFMGPASAEFQRRLNAGKIRHEHNPALAWMVGNAVALTDSNDNVRPGKKKSRARIDGLVACIIGLQRLLDPNRAGPPSETPSEFI